METVITLINIYGPNRDNPDFYSLIEDIIRERNWYNIIWAGDWNLVLNPNLDYENYKNINNKGPRKGKRLDFADVWREINPEIR